MAKFKVGDRIKVIKKGLSSDSRAYFGKEFTIMEGPKNHIDVHNGMNWYSINSEHDSGIYEDEIELVELCKKEIKIYGLAKFCQEMYK